MADDGTVSADRIFTITIENPDDFKISGRIQDTETDAAESTAVADKDIRLEWLKMPSDIDQTVLINVTSDSGTFSFNRLIGIRDEFRVLVPGGG
jgi:hypothetical protein